MTTSTTNKNFKVKNGLDVAGDATFDSNIVLGSTPISFDATASRLKIQIDGQWINIPVFSDIPDTTQMLSFMDIGLSIDYNGQPTYIIQANGVVISGDSKYVVGGSPDTTSVDMIFDSGVIQ